MAVKLVIGGACEDIVLPCARDTFYPDATSCGHYYRCQGYQVWRNKCPPGTASMRRGSTPCAGRSWQCHPDHPRRRCAKQSDTQDGCALRFNLPCQNRTRFVDPASCGHYLTCENIRQGPVLGRKSCDLSARCHLLTNNEYCTSASQPKCHKPTTATVVVGKRADDEWDRVEERGVDHTALIVGLVMATVITLLIVGFLLIIFIKKKQNKKKPPCSPAVTADDPIPPRGGCHSVRYSQVDRPVSTVTNSEPNHYSDICDVHQDSTGSGVEKQGLYTDTSGLYEEIESCRGGLTSFVFTSANDEVDGPLPVRETSRHDIAPRRPTRLFNNTRPWSESFEIPSRKPVVRNTATRPFSLTSISAPRPPIELPRDSCANLDLGYSHPYFVLRGSQSPESPGSPVNPGTQDNAHKYFVLENGVSDLEADAVSIGTTYCEIDDAHFRQEVNCFSNSYTFV